MIYGGECEVIYMPENLGTIISSSYLLQRCSTFIQLFTFLIFGDLFIYKLDISDNLKIYGARDLRGGASEGLKKE